MPDPAPPGSAPRRGTLAVMQPYFFPYAGYFSLIHAADRFVVFDTVQYVRKSWMSRNRILKPDLASDQYVQVGLEKPEYRALLRECRVDPGREWRERLLRQLEHYRRVAPRYAAVVELVRGVLAAPAETLVDFDVAALEAVCAYLGLARPIERFSDLRGDHRAARHPGDWGLVAAERYGAAAYVNAPGGEAFYAPDEFAAAGIRLGFLRPGLPPYPQGPGPFVAGLSILDVLMFNAPEDALAIVAAYTVDWQGAADADRGA